MDTNLAIELDQEEEEVSFPQWRLVFVPSGVLVTVILHFFFPFYVCNGLASHLRFLPTAIFAKFMWYKVNKTLWDVLL